MPRKKYDVAELAKLLKIASEEKPQEMEARLRGEEADAAHPRSMEKVRLWAAIVLGGVAAAVRVGVILSPHSSPESQRWASRFVIAIVTAVVAYKTGKGPQSRRPY